MTDSQKIVEVYRQDKWDQVQRLAARVLQNEMEEGDSDDEHEEEMISVDDYESDTEEFWIENNDEQNTGMEHEQMYLTDLGIYRLGD